MNTKLNMNKQQGFTLIELVMVIVILGILAAVALPKFSNMQKEARTATLTGALGAVNAAIAITHSQAILENKLASTGSITLENGPVTTVYGYPDSLDTGLKVALELSPEFIYAPGATGGVAGTIKHGKATDSATCIITYTPAASATAAPTITTNFAGC